MAKLVFVHGLNTFGDDDVHIGPLNFGRMHERLEREFRLRGVDFFPVTGFGAGSPEEQAEKALTFLERAARLQNADFHLFGQSTGGLVARVLAHHSSLKGRVRSITTIGTPHEGTRAALFGLEFNERYPRLARLFASFGYDTNEKTKIFAHYTPEAMRRFNERFPAQAEIPEYSLICDARRADVSWPLQVFYSKLHEEGGKSDGFVSVESQRRGIALTELALDHFGELGYFFQPQPGSRRRGKKEFERLVETVCSLVST